MKSNVLYRKIIPTVCDINKRMAHIKLLYRKKCEVWMLYIHLHSDQCNESYRIFPKRNETRTFHISYQNGQVIRVYALTFTLSPATMAMMYERQSFWPLLRHNILEYLGATGNCDMFFPNKVSTVALLTVIKSMWIIIRAISASLYMQDISILTKTHKVM